MITKTLKVRVKDKQSYSVFKPVAIKGVDTCDDYMPLRDTDIILRSNTNT